MSNNGRSGADVLIIGIGVLEFCGGGFEREIKIIRKERKNMKRNIRFGIVVMSIMAASTIFFKTTVNAATLGNDTEKPIITSAFISNVSASGYDVSCTVSDNNEVSSVSFPTWTTRSGQDDIVWHKGSFCNGKWIFHISTGDHGNEQGEYVTHVYVYDKAGNSTGLALDSVNVTGSTTAVSSVASNGKPDVHNTPIDFFKFYGKHPSEFRGMPGFTEITSGSDSGTFIYYPEGSNEMWHTMQLSYRDNYISHISFHFYTRDVPYGSNFRIWGIYCGMDGNEAIELLEQQGYECFYVQPNYWQWKDDGRYTVDITWNGDGTVDWLAINPTRRQ